MFKFFLHQLQGDRGAGGTDHHNIPDPQAGVALRPARLLVRVQHAQS